MKKHILILAFFLTACGSPYPQGTPTPTPNPAEIALQMVQQQVASEATAQIVGLQFTATAQVLAATATQGAYMTQAAVTAQARLDAQATADQARRDAQATQQRIDAEATQAQARIDAQSTADQARLDLQATQTAEASSTAFAMTQQVIVTHEWWTATAVEQSIQLKDNEVDKSDLEVEQQTEKNTWEWAVPTGITIMFAVGLVFYARSHGRSKPITDADGNIKGFLMDNRKVVMTDIVPGPIIDIETNEAPDVTDRQTQNEIIKRDQAIRALGNMPVNPASAGVAAYDRMFNAPVEKKIPTIEVVPAGQINQSVLEDIEGQIVEEG